MTTDKKTLADVQPGGMVRLGDQAERARFEAWLATQHDQGSEHVMATVSATDDRYQSPVTSSMWSAWQAANSAREGGRINGWKVVDGVRVYSAYAHASILDDQQYVRYEDYLAALSAQPSPGGQGDALDLDRVLSLADVHAEESREDGVRLLDRGGLLAFAQDVAAALAARQPVGNYEVQTENGPLKCSLAVYAEWQKNEEYIARLEEELKSARQPVGEPVCNVEGTWLWSKLMEWCKRMGAAPSNNDELFAIAKEANALYAAPAQAVDLGQLPRAVELLSNVSRTLVDWAADQQREAIDIIKALSDSEAVGNK